MSNGDKFIPPLAPDPFDDPINERPPYDWREKRIEELEREVAEWREVGESIFRYLNPNEPTVDTYRQLASLLGRK